MESVIMSENTNTHDVGVIHGYGEKRWSSEKEMVMAVAVAVAVDKTKASQYALKWAADRLLYKDKNKTIIINLVHVQHTSPPISYSPLTTRDSNLVEREPDDYEREMLRPFRGFCARRQIQYEIVVLEDDDVAQALVDFTIRHRVENLILGASSRNGLSRVFKPSSGSTSRGVMKWIPNYCNVYVISKLGKLNDVRSACHPVPLIIPSLLQHQATTPHHHIVGVSRGRGPASEVLFEDAISVSASEIESSCTSPSPGSASPSPHRSMILSFFETLESHLARSVSPSNNFASSDSRPLHGFRCGRTTSLFLTHKLESMQEEMMRIKSKQNQKMDILYHVSCKEASLAAKHGYDYGATKA